MGNNYFNDMGSAVEDDEEFDLEAEDKDDDDDNLNDLSDHANDSHYDMDDLEEYQGPRFGNQGMMDFHQEDLDLQPNNEMDVLPDNDDLSLSTFKDNGETHRKSKSKLLIIFIVLALAFCGVAGVIVYAVFARDVAPAVRMVHIESDDEKDPTTAKYGNMITLSFEFNKDLDGLPTVIIMGRQVEVFGEGRQYYAKYFVQDQGEEDQVVSFSIQNYKDSFRKGGLPVTNTTDNSKVVIVGYHFNS